MTQRGQRGPYRNGIKRREQIIDAAMTAFAGRGFHASSMRQIAAAVGLSPAALARHFESKDDLLASVLNRWAELTTEQGMVNATGLDHYFSQHRVMEFHTANPGLLQLFIILAVEATNRDHPAHAFMGPRYDRTIEEFANSLIEAADRGDIAPITLEAAIIEARRMIAVMDGLEIQWFLDPTMDLVAEFDDYLATAYERWKVGRPPHHQPAPAIPNDDADGRDAA